LDAETEEHESLDERLLAHSIINLFLWPGMLSGLLERRKFQRDVRTGKIPSWMVLAKGEESGRGWKLSDGTEFRASVDPSGVSSEPVNFFADYEDESLTGEIRYRIRLVAPETGPPTDWIRMEFTPRGPEPDPDDEDAIDDYSASRYEASIKLAKCKYQIEFRVPNRSGKVEECLAVTLINYDSKDYEVS